MINTEAVLIDFLQSKLSSIDVYAEVPTTRPEQFVTIEQTGGSGTLFKSEPQLVIGCWAQSRYQASELAKTVHEYLYDAADECKDIAKVQLNMPYNYPAEEMNRYQFSAQITTI